MNVKFYLKSNKSISSNLDTPIENILDELNNNKKYIIINGDTKATLIMIKDIEVIEWDIKAK